MCGIAGASLSPKDQVNAKRIAKAMLLEIEHRGRDATGFAFRDSNGQFQVHKRDIDATQFVKRNLCLPKASRTFIMHTRFATQGDPIFNENNHPILTAGIVGVHNGHVSNDWELFRDIDDALEVKHPDSIRIGEVDSEAVFALLGYLDYDGDAPKLLEQVRGGAAIAWMNEADESDALYLARLNSSPLIIGETDSGSLLFASTQEAVEAGANVAGLTLKMIRDIPEGTYMRVLDGTYVDVRMFEPAKYLSYSNYTTMGTTRGITDRFSSRGINKDWDEADDFDWYAPGMHPNMTHKERTYQYIMGKASEEPRATVTSLTDRLAQEEPEVYALPDEGDESYEEWWRLNTAANEAAWDRAVDKENERDAESQRRHNEFAAFTRAPYLNSYYLSNIEYPVRVPSEEIYLSEPRNVRRDDSVREWMKCLQGKEADVKRIAIDLKADVFPGFPVTTDVDGIEVFGHLVELPEVFPSGDYLIRAYVRRPKRKTGYEAIFVARQYHEFDVCQFGTTLEGTYEEAKTAKRGTELVKVTNDVRVQI